jgi:hypothetical protein
MFGGSSWVFDTVGGGGYRFRTAGNTDRLRIESTGNVLINTTTDAGYRLDVNGTARVKGTGTTSATTSLLIQNSAGVNLLQVRDDNLLTYASALTLSQTGTRTTFSTSGGSNVNHFRFTTLSSLSSPTGNTVFLDYIASFTPTSGVGTFSALSYTGVINQTGGANGITRGLYINPTLTSAFDFRAIETTAGNVLFGSNLFWDNTNGRLGIGTSSPSTTFAIGSGGINRVNLGLQAFEMYTPSSVRTVFLGYSSTSGQLIIASGGSNDVNFLGGGFKSISTGNFAIGSTTDAGYRLDVNGTARVSGLLTTPAGTNLGGWYLYANGTTNASMFGGSSWVLDTVSGGGYRFRTAGNVDRLRIESSGNVLINTTTDAGFKLDVNGTARVQGALSVTSNIVISAGAGITAPFFNGTVNNFQFGTTAIFLTQTNSVAVASGLRSAFLDSIVWQQSSGTGEFASFRATPTLNTTGLMWVLYEDSTTSQL